MATVCLCGDYRLWEEGKERIRGVISTHRHIIPHFDLYSLLTLLTILIPYLGHSGCSRQRGYSRPLAMTQL